MLHDTDTSVIAGFDDDHSARAAKTPNTDVSFPSVDPRSWFSPEDEHSLDRSNAAAQTLQNNSSYPRETNFQRSAESGTVGVTRQNNEAEPAPSVDAIREIEITFNALHVFRNIAKTIDTRFAELKHLNEEIDIRASALTAQKQTIVDGMMKADQVTELVQGFAGQLETLTEKLDRRLVDFERQEQFIAQTAAQLQQRVVSITADLEQRLGGFNGQKQTIEEALGEATRVMGLLSALETRISQFAGQDRELERANQNVAQLEHRVADTTASLEYRVSRFETQLEQVVAKLRDGAENDVGRLERRAAAAAAQLKHATKAKRDLEYELNQLKAHLSKLTKAAQKDSRALLELRQRTEPVQSPSTPRSAGLERSISTKRRANGARLPLIHTGLVVGGLTALLFGVVAIRGVRRAGEIKDSSNTNSAPALVSRLLPVPVLALPIPAPPKAFAVNARSSRDTVRSASTADVTARVRARDRASADAGAAVQQFIGTLAIESEPSGAAVFLNQRSVGKTPILVTDLRTGSYVVRIEREGYQRWTSVALVSAVRQERMTAKLQRDRPR